MRILHVADLHFDMEHYQWLEKQASAYDLVVVAGDLVEGFHSEAPLPAQKRLVLSSLRRTAQKCAWLAICSGNHDVSSNGEARWMSELRDLPNCILDRQNYLIEGKEKVLITCCPWVEPNYIIGELGIDRLFKEGEVIRKPQSMLWLVVNHSPPGFGGAFLPAAVDHFRPSFVLSGHDHNSPFAKGPMIKREGTWCLNPGCPPAKERLSRPPAIIIDTSLKMMTWKWGKKRIQQRW